MKKELLLLVKNLKMLLATPMKLPKELDMPSKSAYHTHYVAGIMLTIASVLVWTLILKTITENQWLVLIGSIVLSFFTVLIIAYLKELVYDKWFKSTMIDVDDIRFTTYGYFVIAPILFLVSALSILL